MPTPVPSYKSPRSHACCPGILASGSADAVSSSSGGAASVDRAWRREGINSWPDEAITDELVAAAIASGPADVMLTHEPPARTPVRGVREALRKNPMGFPDDALAESAASRAHVAEVWYSARLELLLHGHMHIARGRVTASSEPKMRCPRR